MLDYSKNEKNVGESIMTINYASESENKERISSRN